MSTGSTKPFGATSFKSTAFGIIPREQLLSFEIEGTKRGLEHVESLIRQSSKTEINSELIKELHAISFGWIFPDWAGTFRTIPVTYSDKEAPAFYQIPELTKNLCEDLKVQLRYLPSDTDPQYIDAVISLLAWFQHRFVYIHPFQDYNGRISRMLTILLLLRLHLPAIEISIETEADRKRYLKAMQSGDEGDLTKLQELLGNALTIELNTSP